MQCNCCLIIHHQLSHIWPERKETAKFLQLANDFFDIFNASNPKDARNQMKSGYGKSLPLQENVLLTMEKICSEMRVVGKKNLLPFQRGILTSISSLRGLYHDMNAHGVKYLLTRRLNQDCLEHLFSSIRGLGHFYDHPLPSEVKTRLRLLLLGAHPGSISTGVVSVEDNESEEPIISSTFLSGTNEDVEPDEVIREDAEFRELLEVSNISLREDDNSVLKERSSEMNLQASASQVNGVENTFSGVSLSRNIQEDGLSFVAGYIAYKYKNIEPNLGSRVDAGTGTSNSWISVLSITGGLTEPSDEWMSIMKQFEVVFWEVHGSGVNRETNIIEKLEKMLQIKYPNINKKLIRTYSRTRTFIRIKYLNRVLVSEERKKKENSRRNQKKNIKWKKSSTFANTSVRKMWSPRT